MVNPCHGSDFWEPWPEEESSPCRQPASSEDIMPRGRPANCRPPCLRKYCKSGILRWKPSSECIVYSVVLAMRCAMYCGMLPRSLIMRDGRWTRSVLHSCITVLEYRGTCTPVLYNVLGVLQSTCNCLGTWNRMETKNASQHKAKPFRKERLTSLRVSLSEHHRI